MSFYSAVVWSADEKCDRCRKPAKEKRPIVQLSTQGRSWNDRNFIQLHLDCLEKTIVESRAELEQAEKP